MYLRYGTGDLFVLNAKNIPSGLPVSHTVMNVMITDVIISGKKAMLMVKEEQGV